jgi:hypothetical protein
MSGNVVNTILSASTYGFKWETVAAPIDLMGATIGNWTREGDWSNIEIDDENVQPVLKSISYSFDGGSPVGCEYNFMNPGGVATGGTSDGNYVLSKTIDGDTVSYSWEAPAAEKLTDFTDTFGGTSYDMLLASKPITSDTFFLENSVGGGISGNSMKLSSTFHQTWNKEFLVIDSSNNGTVNPEGEVAIGEDSSIYANSFNAITGSWDAYSAMTSYKTDSITANQTDFNISVPNGKMFKCNGIEVARITDIPSIPTLPTGAGKYYLECVVDGGTTTYQWTLSSG